MKKLGMLMACIMLMGLATPMTYADDAPAETKPKKEKKEKKDKPKKEKKAKAPKEKKEKKPTVRIPGTFNDYVRYLELDDTRKAKLAEKGKVYAAVEKEWKDNGQKEINMAKDELKAKEAARRTALESARAEVLAMFSEEERQMVASKKAAYNVARRYGVEKDAAMMEKLTAEAQGSLNGAFAEDRDAMKKAETALHASAKGMLSEEKKAALAKKAVVDGVMRHMRGIKLSKEQRVKAVEAVSAKADEIAALDAQKAAIIAALKAEVEGMASE